MRVFFPTLYGWQGKGKGILPCGFWRRLEHRQPQSGLVTLQTLLAEGTE